MSQLGFCPSCGDFGELVPEHRDDGRPAYIRYRGPQPILYCKDCVARMKLEKARERQRMSRRSF